MKPLTLEDGSTEVSPFVTLDDSAYALWQAGQNPISVPRMKSTY
jgi:hypothetical protein